MNADEFGQLRYVELDATGAAIARATYATFGAGTNGDPQDPGGVVSDTASIDSVQRPQLVVTPHDEVNVFIQTFAISAVPA